MLIVKKIPFVKQPENKQAPELHPKQNPFRDCEEVPPHGRESTGHTVGFDGHVLLENFVEFPNSLTPQQPQNKFA